MSRWKTGAAAIAVVALALVASPGSIALADQHGGPDPAVPGSTAIDGTQVDPTSPQEEAPFDPADPFDGLDLADPLAAREEVQRRMGETAVASEVLAGLVELAGAELAAAQQRSAAANEWLVTARSDAAAAQAAKVSAEEDAEAAELAADEASDDARAALVDAYMTPPSADAARVSMSLSLSEVNESSFAHGLLASRAERLTEVVEAADEAESAAEDASREASQAATAASAAASEATAAVEAAAAAAEETGERLADLQFFDSLVAAQVDSLEIVDALLEQVVAQREAAAAAAGGPPVAASEVSAVGGTSIRVHRSVVDLVSAMILAAAADGVMLDGYGWRTVESQISLRRSHCGASPEQIYLVPSSSCSPPTARPGSSMHERGLAIDFTDCSERTTVCYQWLAANAHRFGFFNLPSEPWHWSVNGN